MIKAAPSLQRDSVHRDIYSEVEFPLFVETRVNFRVDDRAHLRANQATRGGRTQAACSVQGGVRTVRPSI
jgi:hypothetical protein